MSQANTANRDGTTDRSPSNGTAELQRDIAETRDELAATVAALAAKTDVKARAQDNLRRIRMHGRDRARQGVSVLRERGRDVTGLGTSFIRRGVAFVIAAAAAGAGGWVLIRRRRG
jgi:hypothetical protein